MMHRLQFPKFDDWFTQGTMKIWHRYPLFDLFMVTVAKWTPIVMLVFVGLVASHLFLSPDFARIASLGAASSVIGAMLVRLLNEPVSRWFRRSRPFEEEGVLPLLPHEGGGSFPSNHATGAMALAMGCFYVPGYHLILFTLAGFLCVSRVYCGLHYVTDVWFGAWHGLLVSACVLWCVMMFS
jgi:undecaprenyl-diphosphatase